MNIAARVLIVLLSGVVFLGGCYLLKETSKPQEKISVTISKGTERAWDPRDPEVVYAEHLVKGLVGGTFAFMSQIGTQAAHWVLENPDRKISSDFDAFSREFNIFYNQLQLLLKSPALGVSLKPDGREVKKLYDQLAVATEAMFRVTNGISAKGGVLTPQRVD